MADPEITQRLDTIISILKLTNRNALAGARNELDDVAKALIDGTEEPVVIGALKRSVANATGQSDKTVQRRISDLVALGALAKTGGGTAATYRSTGLL
jgi:hypothetical protein